MKMTPDEKTKVTVYSDVSLSTSAHKSRLIVFIVAFLLIVAGSLWILNAISVSNEENKIAGEALVTDVKEKIESMSPEERSFIASTSTGGYQGDIERINSSYNGGVKITVSTYYKESGMDKEGGQNIAWKIMSLICNDIPNLDSVYVTSSSSGLDSSSVYRSDIPACKNT